MKSNNNILLSLDWIAILIYLTLVMMGWVNIYAAVYSEEHQSIFDLGQQYGKQMIWIVAGIFLAICVLIVDSKFYVAFEGYVAAYYFTALLAEAYAPGIDDQIVVRVSVQQRDFGESADKYSRKLQKECVDDEQKKPQCHNDERY